MKPDRISQYEITGELGQGSMGVVYEGWPADGGPSVAVKVFYPDPHLTADEVRVLRERFEREGSALAGIQHDNIVHVVEVGTEGNLDYIVMEKLEGLNLKELASLGTRFTLADTFDVLLQLLSGLSACHRAGVVHRDVKPANIIRAQDGKLRLTDFGIARVITDQTLARAGTIVGTPNYMSPEQIKGDKVDARTDLFSAGVLMYELMTGKKPFDGPDMTAIMYNVANVHPPSPRFYNGALPPQIEEIVFKALAKNPDERYSTAGEFADDLRSVEQALRYRDDSIEILNALPAAPDQDALLTHQPDAAPGQGIAPTTAAASIPAIKQSTIGGITQGKIYCIDCGMENEQQAEFCIRCMRPLIKRDLIHQLAAQQAKLMYKLGRGDYFFFGCLSVVIVATVILILYLFFRGV